jgi:FKBP12-rapamycin complex-associated protein
MSNITSKLNENTVEGAFLRAVVAVKEDNYPQAINYINKVRDTFDSELTAMAAESYERAYSAIVMAQHLTELEEAIEYKLVPERRTRIAVVWSRRLQGISLDVDQWHKALIVRQLVMSKNELRPMWIKFAGLCRKKGKPEIAARTLRNLIDAPEGADLHNIQLPYDRPQLTLAIIKQIWNENHRSNAIEKLEILTSQLMKALQSAPITPDQIQPIARVTAKCYVLLGDWQSSYGTHGHGIHSANASPSPSRHASVSSRIHTPTGSSHHGYYRNQKGGGHTSSILNYYLTATRLQHHWQKAWKRLAILYYDLVMDKARSDDGSSHLINPLLSDYSTFETQFEQSQANTSNVRTPHVQDSNDDTAAPRNFTVPSNEEHPANEWTDQNIPVYQDNQHQQFQKFRANEPPSPSHSIVIDSETIGYYAQEAVKCYFKAIQFSEGSSLEDTLRLFMLWVEHGNRKIVEDCIKDGIKIISPETWLEIAPQLITRLDLDDDVGKLIKELVTNVAKAHPHGLIYPLIAAKESKNAVRAAAAKDILATLSETNLLLVQQGQMLNHELIRCAILWHEQWHETLEEASKIFFHPDGPKDINQMLALMRPLHEKLNGGHQTLKEFSFIQTYYKELKEAFDYCEKYRRTNDHNDINGAWDIYYNVFRRISHQLRQLTSLDLNYVAPTLAAAKNLILCVPGTYDPNGRLIKIQSIDPILPVILSKQRPRKLTMRGDDGNEYVFLLKGHEDPRQDERVMQLFGLINTLILKDPETCRRDLTIQRYAIIALSQTSGLIGWVPNCDTLHALIKDYREKRNISISEENDKMQELCPGYHSSFERLTLMQKVEIFREALRKTKGNDLRDTLWMKSPTSEVWFDRRTNFTRSMACSSMVGYILGLGDRHPSNVMLDRLSGKIVHIDFGDCFEVAMRREKYPERVPFRLTRMLIHAMEVTGIEGNYRITCERILRLIRQNRFSILAVLEAFVYDPVVNWFKIPETGREAETNRRRNQSMYEVMDSHVRARSKEAIDRVKDKLNGYDFIPPHHNPSRDGIIKEMDVRIHVERLIEQATLAENLCQGYIGWCPFW